MKFINLIRPKRNPTIQQQTFLRQQRNAESREAALRRDNEELREQRGGWYWSNGCWYWESELDTLREQVAELEGQLKGARATARDNAEGVAEANARVAELEGALERIAHYNTDRADVLRDFARSALNQQEGVRVSGPWQEAEMSDAESREAYHAYRQKELIAKEGQLKQCLRERAVLNARAEDYHARVAELEGALRGVAGDLAEARLHHEQGKFSDEAHRDGLERTEEKARRALNQHQGEQDK